MVNPDAPRNADETRAPRGRFALIFGAAALAASVGVACVSAATRDGPDGPIEVTARPLALDPEQPNRRDFGELRYLGGLTLSSSDSRFGGLSGVSLRPDGLTFDAVSDIGWLISGRLQLDGERPVGVADTRIHRLKSPRGKPLIAKTWADSEGATRWPDAASDELWVSFEGRSRIARYRVKNSGAPIPLGLLRLPPRTQRLPKNGGLETIAALGDGRVFLAAEDPTAPGGDHFAWVMDADGRAEEMRVVHHAGFSPTDAAALPNGDILLLERRYTVVGGPSMRIRRIARGDMKSGARLDGPVLVELTVRYAIDNMEAITIRPLHPERADDDEVMVIAMSDDNYRVLQTTVLLAFAYRWR